MIFDLFITVTANNSILEILDNIESRYGSGIRKKWKREFKSAFIIIESNPFVGRHFGLYRQYIVGKTIFFYRVDVKSRKIFIMHAFDCRRDWSSLLG